VIAGIQIPAKKIFFVTIDYVIMEDKRTGEPDHVLKCRFWRTFFNENQRKYSKNPVKFGAFVELTK